MVHFELLKYYITTFSRKPEQKPERLGQPIFKSGQYIAALRNNITIRHTNG